MCIVTKRAEGAIGGKGEAGGGLGLRKVKGRERAADREAVQQDMLWQHTVLEEVLYAAANVGEHVLNTRRHALRAADAAEVEAEESQARLPVRESRAMASARVRRDEA